MKIITKNPVDVQMHWTRKLLPKPSQERVNALSDSIAKGAKLPPGYLVEPNLLVAGETRRLAHKARQVDMDFIVITEDEAMAVALQENTNRFALKFKYQIAFSYCPLAAKVVEHSNKSKGFGHDSAKSAAVALYANYRTLDDVADALQISRRTLADAKETYDALLAWDAENEPKFWGDFKKTKLTALDYWTLRIMDQEESCTPGQARAGLGGSKAAEQGKTQPDAKPLQLMLSGFSTLEKWGKKFSNFDDGEQRKIVGAVKKTVSAWPAELREVALAELKRMKLEEKEQ